MNVAELITLLQEFPAELPVFFCPDTRELNREHATVEPQDAVMNLVDRARKTAMAFSEDGESYIHEEAPDGYVDAVVVYSRRVREPE